jgi:hypothetical protein
MPPLPEKLVEILKVFNTTHGASERDRIRAIIALIDKPGSLRLQVKFLYEALRKAGLTQTLASFKTSLVIIRKEQKNEI